nr:unnamed protein product [Callosobruchus analis]
MGRVPSLAELLPVGIISTLPRTIRYECPEEYNHDEGSKVSETSSQVSVEIAKSTESIEEDLQESEDSYNIHLDMSVLKTRRQLGPVCKYFTNIQDFAYYLVDDIIDEAQDILATRYNRNVQYAVRHSTTPNILWPTIGEFTREVGAMHLRKYIDLTSEVIEDWEYSVNLTAGASNSVSDFYTYEAVFSIPTKCYPVPQATATVFFTYEVSRVKPKNCVVDVETLRTVLYPEKNVITEDMLFRVLNSKLNFFKTVTY